MPRLTKEQEIDRVKGMFAFDEDLLQRYANSSGFILGIDEVGRGPVAGPVCAGGVVFDRNSFVYGLNDSKKISANKRILVSENVRDVALFSTVQYCNAKIIDEIGIAEALKSVFRGVVEACEAAGFEIGVVLLDGNPMKIDDREINIVKGDSKSASIAAASVVAKVERDNYMDALAYKYPNYHFEKNKGYGTGQHLNSIKSYGVCPEHRLSFLKKYI